jgi:hypothetical protein
MCDELCDGADACAASPPANCETRCLAGATAQPPLLPSLSATQCKLAWDELTLGDRCEANACMLYCADVCRIAESCELVAEPTDCVEGCLARAAPCPGATPSDCLSVPGDVVCYESAASCS